MKELTIEQKAKAYDEALKQIKECTPDENGFITIYPQEIFPELAESEDEKIRKALIKLVKKAGEGYENVIDGVSIENAISWLKKQGKQKPAWSEEDLICLGYLADFVDKNGDDFYGKNKPNVVKWIRSFAELPTHIPINEIEQKPVPKFKTGDTMRTLQEARDGFTNGMPVVVSIDEEYYHCTNELIAIKDQDKYEYPPMNIRQKPAWSEEDEYCINQLIVFCENCMVPDSGAKRCANWLKSLKERYTWRPSDEQIRVVARLRHCLLEDVRGNDVVILDNLLEQLKAL